MENEVEALEFDKFMDDILVKESRQLPRLIEETPQRKYVKKYVERSCNRIKFSKVP
jgi:hypothetical protein